MKKKIIAILCLIVCAFLLNISLPSKVGADSGWDGGYGGGGGSFGGSGGGSGGSSSWGSSGSSGGSINIGSEGYIILPIFFTTIAVIIFFIVFSSIKSEKELAKQRQKIVAMDKEKQLELDKKLSEISNFNLEEFKQKTFETYKNIQIAWMNFDYDNLRKNCTDELYNLYYSQLEVLKMKNQQNIMKDFDLKYFKIIDSQIDGNIISIKIAATIMCNDYVIDSNTKKVLRGRETYKVIYDYEMTFITARSNENNVCPNCNAKLEEANSNQCSYCDSVVISSNYDWVLAKKEVTSQTYQ